LTIAAESEAVLVKLFNSPATALSDEEGFPICAEYGGVKKALLEDAFLQVRDVPRSDLGSLALGNLELGDGKELIQGKVLLLARSEFGL
jgi:hypothetical protein